MLMFSVNNNWTADALYYVHKQICSFCLNSMNNVAKEYAYYQVQISTVTPVFCVP